jgi:heme/copper-type cytochrome/quinol oxidase subunit 2
MTVGGSIFLVAVGAILRYAVTDSISGIDLATVGLILMIAGILGLVIGLFMYVSARRTPYAGPVERERVVERDPRV